MCKLDVNAAAGFEKSWRVCVLRLANS